MKRILFIAILVLIGVNCFSQIIVKEGNDWLSGFDLDGDNIKDKIYFDYSGGAHCCYKINIVLSSTQKEVKYPFEMDGGYIGNVDNSLPEQFNIFDADGDGWPEIVMKIQTYNNVSERIPNKWTKKYGIKTNKILIDYSNNELKVKDYNPNN